MNLLFIKLEDYLLPCLNKQLFGIDCPGCGMQRSIVHLTRGEFSEALYMYPAVYSILLLLIMIVLNKRLKFSYGKKIILTLVIINAAIISISYMIKMNHFLSIN